MIWHLDLDEIREYPYEDRNVFDELTEGLGIFALTVFWVLLLTYSLGPIILN